MIGSRLCLRGYFLIAGSLLLAACVPVQKIKQEEADQAKLHVERQERDAYDKCTQTLMPGSTEHLACRMGAPLTK